MSRRPARRTLRIAAAMLLAACEPPMVAPTTVETVTPTVAPTELPTQLPQLPQLPTPTPTVGFRCDPAVLDHEPSEAFDLLGIIEVQSRRPGGAGASALESAKLQACALGGDAIVLLYRNERQGGSPSVITGPSAMLPSPEIRAAVIRYHQR